MGESVASFIRYLYCLSFSMIEWNNAARIFSDSLYSTPIQNYGLCENVPKNEQTQFFCDGINALVSKEMHHVSCYLNDVRSLLYE